MTDRKPLSSEDYYHNAEGLMVFTAAYHLKRGYCCGSGCKHCPYSAEDKKMAEELRKDPSAKSLK